MPSERPRISTQSLAGLLAGLPNDADLLARFVANRDESAFELLLRRHAALVLATCRRILSDPNDADDAFQATFLVLARKAGSISRKEVVASWLHRVALRAALRVRTARARRTSREQPGVEEVPAPPAANGDLPDLYRVLDEELGRLPAHHRAAFILCCLEGKTGEEAGQLLGCPPGTISSRLTRARERLRKRLIRRGFAGAGLGTLVLASDSLAASPTAIVIKTLPAALAFASGRKHTAVPVRSKVIAEGVLRTMLINKLRIASAAILGLLLTGAVLIGTGSGAGPEVPPSRKKAAEDQKFSDVTKKSALPKVHLVKPQAGGIERMTSQVAIAEPYQKTDVYPAVTGILKRMSVNIGDKVKTGQVLAEIDAPDLVLAEKQARISVESAESVQREAEAAIASAKAAMDVAKGLVKQRESEEASAKAKLDYRKKQFDRIKQLYEQKSVDAKLLDEQEDQFRAAQGQVDAAKIAISTAIAQLEASKTKELQAEAAMVTALSKVRAAQVELQRADLSLSRTKIVAPFDGVVTRRNGGVGDSVQSATATSQPLLTLMLVNAIRVVVGVPQREAPLAKPGVPAELTFDAYPDRKFAAKIARVGYAVDDRNRTMRIEFDVPNRQGEILPGMTGAATIPFGKGPADAVRVPFSALLNNPLNARGGQHKWAVYVYRDGKAHLTFVGYSGFGDGEKCEVLSGLKTDDQVILDPVDVHDGSFVTVESEESRK